MVLVLSTDAASAVLCPVITQEFFFGDCSRICLEIEIMLLLYTEDVNGMLLLLL